MTPYPANSIEREKVLYNKAHCKTRCVVERTIGVWKARFRAFCRYTSNGMSELQLFVTTHFTFRTGGILSYTPEKTCKLIVCGAVLHNLCRDLNIPLLQEDNDLFEHVVREHQENFEQLQVENQPVNNIRESLANYFFQNGGP